MEPLEFIVRAGPHARVACPVWVQLPVPPAPAPTLRLFDDVGNESLAVFWADDFLNQAYGVQ